jgi:DDE family transposase
VKPENQLIQLYLWVCRVYDKHPQLKYQRWSPNMTEPLFSDQELITVYLFGHLQRHFQQKAIHRYVQGHWGAWFPRLPSYQAFNQRLNLLSGVWPVLLGELWSTLALTAEASVTDQLLDSLPIMLAVRGRSCQAKVARDQADQGYCESKHLYYHGVKLHLLGAKQYHQLPVPLSLCLTEASRHDLPVLKEQVLVPLSGTLFGDKAYLDQATLKALADQGTTLCTPDKKEKGQQVYKVGQSGLWSRFVSAMRQPIESFFNWLLDKTDIQNAAKVRSSEGLLVHCYGKLTAAFYLLCSNP